MGNEIKSFKDLQIWLRSMDIVTKIYQCTKEFPSEELYALTSQIRRSAVSIPSNIAEGYGRNSTKDYIRFLQISNGSLYELETQLQIAKNLGYVTNEIFNSISQECMEISKMLNTLIRKLNVNTR